MRPDKIRKEDVLQMIESYAVEYRDKLLNKNILFLCLDKHKNIFIVETLFDDKRYRHLTGIDMRDDSISAADFYQRCLHNRLSVDDFDIKNDGRTMAKMRALKKLISNDLCARMIGDYAGTRPYLYTEKVAGGTVACMGFIMNESMCRYIPNTVLEVNIKDIVKTPMRIIMTCRKGRNDKEYTEVVYSAKNVEWDKIKAKLLNLDKGQDLIALIDKTIAFRSGHLQHDKTQDEKRQNSDNMTTEEIKKQIADYLAQKSAYVNKCTERLPQSLKNGYAMKAQEDFDKQHAEEAKEVAALKKILEEREPKRPKQNEGKDRGGR